jgi:hypothetical protein
MTSPSDEERPRQEQTPRRRTEESRRRRRRAKVFGDVLPNGSRDERGETWGDVEPPTDDWLRGQVPPHHGG